MTIDVRGPAWSSTGLGRHTGRNPLAVDVPAMLLHAWPAGTALREVLLLGSAFPPDSVERDAIPAARARGARTTVVSDAAHAAFQRSRTNERGGPDPHTAHMAGRGYLHALAAARGAFHPKLALLLGDGATRLAVGTGAPAGPAAGDELWTVVSCDDNASHAMLADLADWLDALPGAVRLAPWAAERLAELAELVTERHIEADETEAGEGPEARLLHNLDTPLLDQLPRGPVDELHVHARFLDPAGHALRALVERLDPKHVVVAVQARWTGYDPAAVAAALDGRSAEARLLDDDQVRHAKLVQWRIGDHWTALAGGPGLTPAALTATARDGGDIELAVLAPGDAALLPDGSTLDPAALPGPYTGATPSLVLLGARTDGSLVTVELAQAQPVAVDITAADQAGNWRTVGSVPAGQLGEMFAPGVAPGTALRASHPRADGTLATSPVVFAYGAVADTRRPEPPVTPTAPVARPVVEPAAPAAAVTAPAPVIRPVAVPREEPTAEPVAPVAPIAPVEEPRPVVPVAAEEPFAGEAEADHAGGYADEPVAEPFPEVVIDGPFAEALGEFAESGWRVYDDAGLWEVTGTFGNPMPVAAKVADRLGRDVDGVVLVRAQSKGEGTFIAWRAPDLVLINLRQKVWRSYQVTPPTTPASSLGSGNIAALPAKTTPRAAGAPPALARMLAELGMEYAELVARVFD
ncbi:hypothetical protein [Yinghuangia seranimata]|uniref:hypothetical protein n=1 Tax=Yinghuangia seranimata TaxID=408067 RepID=UPI00248C5A08|nr:hypothetical protein [Yinghuangia seranimata]MDI2128787.1 hypothetical protein [Yinghuangia seranimata]